MQWVIGDLHGMLEELKQVISQIDEKDPEAIIYFTGDFCDRGYDSKGVVDFVIAGGDRFKCVRGNHDDVFDCIISGKPTVDSEDKSSDAPLGALSWFLNYGMLDTFASYGKDKDAVKAGLRSLASLRSLVKDIPQSHAEFYANLPLVQYGDGFFVTHAYVPPNSTVADALQFATLRTAMLWGRFEPYEVKETKSWNMVGYFGHTPTNTKYGSKDAVIGNDIVLIDTGAVFGNKLSAICHETKELVSSSHESDGLLD